METLVSNDSPAGRNLGDIPFHLLRYRKLIFAFAMIGAVAATIFYLYSPASYTSEAKLLVRYVLERSAIDPVESHTNSNSGARAGNSVINSELEILTSWDLALEAADAVGIDRLTAPEGNPQNRSAAASRIQAGLRASSNKGSNVILVEYTDRDPQLAVAVLDKLVNLYFDKHLEVHRSIGAFAFVSEQSKNIQARLEETDRRLKELKLSTQVVSVADAASAMHANIVRREAELDAARADLAAQKARVDELERRIGATRDSPAPQDHPDLFRYTSISARLGILQRQRLEMLNVFTPENALVKSNEAQIERLTAQKAELEERDPSLLHSAASPESGASKANWVNEHASLAALEARIETLEGQLREVRRQADRFLEISPEIGQLERRKESEAAHQRYFETSLERARIDEALDPAKIPNISVVQRPSPATADFGERDVTTAALAGGGLAFGCGLAMVFGLMFDRTIKRSWDIEQNARLSYLASVPLIRALSRPNHERKQLKNGSNNRSSGKTERIIQRYSDAIRDRLILGFEMSGKTHQPKIVALTGCTKGAGTSSIAAGLAEALSRTGRGKVLLVDMNALDHLRPMNGCPAIPVTELLRAGSAIPPTSENLYLAAGTTLPTELRRPLPVQIRELIPHLRTSDFDYIILDLPATAESSAALTAAGFVDKVVLVVPAETVTPEVLRRTYNELATARGDVAIVFNRERDLVPAWFAADN